ncbi:MAG: hypothetical protein IT209_04300 [Armatimonadetes bacterium]|nr:hypothetical protein [Armatimonadota bacterium]
MSAPAARPFNDVYRAEHLSRVAFPLGGTGAGMCCLEGTGALSHFSLRHSPEVYNEPRMFAGLAIAGRPDLARVVEGPVPMWKAYGLPGAANGGTGQTWGLPRFGAAEFRARFPFGMVSLSDPALPVAVEITGWSPFTPPDIDDSSLPVACLEYRVSNISGEHVSGVLSFNTANFLTRLRTPGASVKHWERGFTLVQPGSEEHPEDEAHFHAELQGLDTVHVNTAWFRGGWFDPLTTAWKAVQQAAIVDAGPITDAEPSPGASLYAPLEIDPGKEQVVRLLFSWYIPCSTERHGQDVDNSGCGEGSSCCSSGLPTKEYYRPWYAARYDSIDAVASDWRERWRELREKSSQFADCFFRSTLPPEVTEAIASNLAILKSPTVLRQTDGRIWAWEGCCDSAGCCSGSCTHVWNYAQAMPHLFPSAERSLRQTEFHESQDEYGHQNFRSSLPVRPAAHDFHAAADGQLGGVIKVYRDWRTSGDTEWMKGIWPRVKDSLDYCIATWDPRETGTLEEPHHNTYDIEFWGPDGMCTSFYLGALRAALEMGKALGEETGHYETLLKRGVHRMESELFDGEYFFQKIQWENLRAPAPTGGEGYSPEALELLQTEGPKYQYGRGCLSDGVLGAWMARVSGLGDFLDAQKLRSHLQSVHRYNYRKDLSTHANPQRPTYAFAQEGGLLLCSWPKDEPLTLPFPYGNEVWTGIEYQVASHLMMYGLVEEGLQIVRTARDRYDGRFRNPFDEYECGHWYARAMSSYGLLQGLTGIRYDAVDRELVIAPSIPGDFVSFLSTATGYGNAGIRGGKPFLDVCSGSIDVSKISYTPCAP